MSANDRSSWFGRLPGGPAVLIGASLSILTMGYAYSYCPDGPARGLPFSILRPSHQGTTPTTLFVGDVAGIPTELNLTGIFADIVVWSAAAAAIMSVFGRLLRTPTVSEADRLV